MAIEQTGLIPRSITRTLERFFNELLPTSEEQVIQEFRVSRSQAITSLYYFLRLLFVPLVVGIVLYKTSLGPFTNFIAFQKETNSQIGIQKLIVEQTSVIEEIYYFDNLRYWDNTKNPLELTSLNPSLQRQEKGIIDSLYKEKAESEATLFAFFFSISLFIFLAKRDKARLSILKSFLDESLYGLNDSTKAFFLILVTDIFVGFHSPKGWEVVLDKLSHKFGLSVPEESVMIFVATFPVLLDTIFKYWIFRYLNRLSPSAVATYHDMNE